MYPYHSSVRGLFTRCILLISCSLLSIFTSFAQQNYQPGYVISLSGDTLQGQIDYHNWEKNPEAISFKVSPMGPVTQYAAKEIKGFRVAGETYRSAEVTLDKSPFKTFELTEGLEYKLETSTVFLLELVSGEKKLYHFQDAEGKNSFFIELPTGIELLKYKRYLRRDDMGNLGVDEDKKYVGQLTLYLIDCPRIQPKLAGLRYERKYMMALFDEYYACTGKKAEAVNKAVAKPFEFGVVAGMSITHYAVFDGPEYMTGVTYPASTRFTGGLFYNLVFPRNMGRLAIKNELLYFSFLTENTTEKANNYIITTRNGMDCLMLNSMLTYRYPVNKVKLFGNLGISAGYGFKVTNYREKYSYFQHQTTIDEGLQLTRAYLGVNMGAGVSFSRIGAEVRYNMAFKQQGRFSDAYFPGYRSNSLCFLLSYRIAPGKEKK